MKRRSKTALVAAIAVIAIGIFVSFSLSFSDTGNDSYVITLPGQGSAVIDTSPDIGQSNRDQVQVISVDKNNIQAIVASLKRPETYQYQVETTYYYRDTNTVLKSQLWKDGSWVRISQLTADEQQGQQALLTDSWVYLWGQGRTYQRYARQEQDMDLYSRTPSYEDLLLLSSEQILEGSVRELDGHLCLYARSKDDLTGEIEQWYVLVENGLLLYADGVLEGVKTYQTQITNLQLELSEGDIFVLPNGAQPE